MASNIRGLSRALERVGRIPSAAREARREVLNEWSDDTKRIAQERAPERTGRLSSAVEGRVYDTQGVARVGVFEGESLEYAQYVEQGTSSMREQPYLVPAFEETRAGVPRKYRAAFMRRVRGE